MAQNREPPAFQEYAASIMARTPYRIMSLAGRGLLYSLRLECWVNRALPSDPSKLARMLGYEATELEAVLPEVMPFFAINGDALTCPELDDYRQHIVGVKAKQSQGGKQTAAKHNEKRKRNAESAGNLSGDLEVTSSSLVKPNSAQSRPVKTNTALKGGADDQWLGAYERASNGY